GIGPSLFLEAYGGNSGNNPNYSKNFVGKSSNGTGDNVIGHMQTLNMTGAATGALQFDFAQPLTSANRIMLTVIDYNEDYTISAFQTVGVNFVQVSTAGWVHQTFSGQAGITPDMRWPVWNGANGTLTATGNGLSENLDTLVPDNSFERLVVTKTN